MFERRGRVHGLGWDTVKDLVKEGLERDFVRPQLKGLRHLSIDEICVGDTNFPDEPTIFSLCLL